ncbi:MAG: hypothetical protein IT385_28220 [Deltaproteobacteria bacterium]|nr:hypothetical protein [Deltaproteobacteria bacterium]
MAKKVGSSGVEVLSVALDLEAEEEARRATERERVIVREAAAELGVDARHVEDAERVVAERAAESARRARRRGRALAAIVSGLLAIGGGTAAWAIATARPDPWSERFEHRDRWALATSRGTMAFLTWSREEGREVATVRLDHVDADTSWYVDLRGAGLPPIERGHERVVIEVAGTLPAARLCLHAGPDERWCSPDIELRAGWREHALTLRSFVHERIIDGRWREPRRSDRRPPSDVTEVSLRLGKRVNPPRAIGVVRVASIRVE